VNLLFADGQTSSHIAYRKQSQKEKAKTAYVYQKICITDGNWCLSRGCFSGGGLFSRRSSRCEWWAGINLTEDLIDIMSIDHWPSPSSGSG